MITKTILQKIYKSISQFRFHRLNDTSNLTEDEIQIQEIALQFAKEKIKPYAIQWEKEKFFPKETFRQAAELGFSNVYITEQNGGTGLSRHAGTLIFEALATGCISTSAYLSIHNMNSWIFDKFGTKEQIDEYLPSLMKLDLFTSYCLTEPNSGSDAAAMKTTAVGDGDDFVINGQKMFISGGGKSDIYMVMLLTGVKERSCIIVPKDSKGLSFGKPEHKMGWNNSPTTTVMFDNVRVPKRNLIGERGGGFKIAMIALDGGRLNIGATSLGGAGECLARTSTYLQDRKQFGTNLNEFQALRFTLAENAVKLQTSRLILRDAAKKLDNNHPDKTMYCAMAKYFSTQQGFEIIDDCLQLHGGYGYLSEYEIEKFARDCRVNRILEGTNEIMKHVISRTLVNKNKL